MDGRGLDGWQTVWDRLEWWANLDVVVWYGGRVEIHWWDSDIAC